MIINILIGLSLLFSSNLEKRTLTFTNGKKLTVEVADTFNSRYKGLMDRTELPEDEGMLFVFPQPQKLSFWMKNTYIPLSIAYLNKDKKIKEIYHMSPQSLLEREPSLEHYPSHCLCQYAIEVNQDWFKKNKIKIGDKVSF